MREAKKTQRAVSIARSFRIMHKHMYENKKQNKKNSEYLP